MQIPTDTELFAAFRQWYKATTNHDPDSQSTVLYSQFARYILNRTYSPIDDEHTKFGGTE